MVSVLEHPNVDLIRTLRHMTNQIHVDDVDKEHVAKRVVPVWSWAVAQKPTKKILKHINIT